MIWLITIVTFLGAVVAVMLVFLFSFRREQILAALRKLEQQRMEARIPTRVALELSGPDEPLIYEITEKITGHHGSQIVYLDDRLENLEPARQRGWHTIHHRDLAA